SLVRWVVARVTDRVRVRGAGARLVRRLVRRVVGATAGARVTEARQAGRGAADLHGRRRAGRHRRRDYVGQPRFAEARAAGARMILDAFKLEGQVALVTGASAGLGAAIAVALAEAGADVACHGNSRAPDRTCEAITALGRRAISVRGDLQNRDVPRRLVETTVGELGRIDILVNNAGTIRRAAAVDYAEDDWDLVIEVNLSSVFRLSQLAGKTM